MSTPKEYKKPRISKFFSLFALLLVVPLAFTAVKAESEAPKKFEFSNSFSPAIYNPPPVATFTSPTDASTTTEHKINVSFDLKANNSDLVGKNVYVQLFVVNSSSTTDQNAYFELLDDYKVITFTSTTESKSLTFNNVPLLYSGDNYIYCYVQTSSGADFCGGFYTPNILNVKYTGKKAALYRFYSQQYTGHFYTTNAGEKKDVINNYSDFTWFYEGIAYFVTGIDGQGNCLETGRNQVFRFWNASAKHHFYTSDVNEKNNVIANNPAYAYEGVTFCADTSTANGGVPVYRFYSATKKSHFYTANEEEKNSLIANDPSWAFEGISYYAYN